MPSRLQTACESVPQGETCGGAVLITVMPCTDLKIIN